MKICKNCQQEKELQFERKICKECFLKESRDRHNEKMQRKCIQCNKVFIFKNKYPICSARCNILSKIEMVNDCWLWKGSFRGSYGTMSYKCKGHLVHRVSYMVFIGEITEGLCVLHKCDNPKCCNPEHLFLGTHKENTHDMITKGRMRSFIGENSPSAILSEADVREIRNLLKNGQKQVTIAKAYGLKQSTISDIKRRKNWSHVVD